MRDKGYITRKIENIFITIKSYWIVIVFLFAIIYIWIPLLNTVCYINNGDVIQNIISNVILFYPILFIPIESIYLRQYIEDKGCELLYMYRKSVIFDIWFILILYFCILIPPLCIYTIFIGSDMMWLIVKVIAISVFFHSITYMMSYVTGSIIMAGGICLLICLNAICNIIRQLDFIMYYFTYMDSERILNQSIILLFWSCIL